MSPSKMCATWEGRPFPVYCLTVQPSGLCNLRYHADNASCSRKLSFFVWIYKYSWNYRLANEIRCKWRGMECAAGPSRRHLRIPFSPRGSGSLDRSRRSGEDTVSVAHEHCTAAFMPDRRGTFTVSAPSQMAQFSGFRRRASLLTELAPSHCSLFSPCWCFYCPADRDKCGDGNSLHASVTVRTWGRNSGRKFSLSAYS